MQSQFQRIMLFAALGLTLVMIWQSWVDFQANYNGASSLQETVENVSGLTDNLNEDTDQTSGQC